MEVLNEKEVPALDEPLEESKESTEVSKEETDNNEAEDSKKENTENSKEESTENENTEDKGTTEGEITGGENTETEDKKEDDTEKGEETEKEELKNFSIVTFNHLLEDKDIGTIGIIGPTRMDYSKVISVMKYISKKLNDDFKKGKY